MKDFFVPLPRVKDDKDDNDLKDSNHMSLRSLMSLNPGATKKQITLS